MYAHKDQNQVPVKLAMKNDGATIIQLRANPTTHAVMAVIGTGGSNNGPDDADRDENHIPVLMAVSSEDGVTPVCLYLNSSHRLIMQA